MVILKIVILLALVLFLVVEIINTVNFFKTRKALKMSTDEIDNLIINDLDLNNNKEDFDSECNSN